MIRVAICTNAAPDKKSVKELLLRLYSESGATGEMPEILYTDEGKACFDKENENNSLQIDTSYDGGVLVVAIADGCSSLGVDVQSSSRAEMLLGKIGELFARNVGSENSAIIEQQVKYHFYKACAEGLTELSEEDFSPKELSADKASSDSLAKWTLLEATMKCTAKDSSPRTKTVTFKVNKKCYAVSIAVVE